MQKQIILLHKASTGTHPSPFTLMSCVNSRGLNQSLHDHCNKISTSSSWWDKVESHVNQNLEQSSSLLLHVDMRQLAALRPQGNMNMMNYPSKSAKL
jgi:hypothetical protein